MNESTLINTRLGLRIDWVKKLMAHLRVADWEACTHAVAEYQLSNHLLPSGIIDAPTRLSLIRTFPDLSIQTIGLFRAPDCILDSSQPEDAQYLRIKEILLSHNHFVAELENAAQILAIRGVRLHDNGWYRTDSALRFASSPYGSRTHFSSDKPNYFDSLFAVTWREHSQRHVRLFPGTVNPNDIWPQGTAHLCMGQYFFKIGRHRTRNPDHVQSVLDHHGIWPDEWFCDISPDSVQYLALEGTSPIEIVRSHDNALDISEEDIQRAEAAIARREPTYVDEHLIKINIHTCAADHASSLGCQNISPDYYQDFMDTLLQVQNRQIVQYGFALDIPYSLIDGSFIE